MYVRSESARHQAGIQPAFVHATFQVQIGSTEVVPFPRFRVLDGRLQVTTASVLSRVHMGSRKTTAALLDVAAAPAGTTFGDFISTPGAQRVVR